MLEAVHGVGELLKSGWKPKRTIIFASWDAEEEGLMGSTEWGEEHAPDLGNAAAYFNMDVAVSGKKFGASAEPTLKEFVREITKAVPSPQGGTVYDEWRKSTRPNAENHSQEDRRTPAVETGDAPVGDLGSGSDYSVFIEHLGVPSTDIGSNGAYGVYHSAFDNFAWFKKFGDPDFVYEQQMARVYGLEALRMSDADVLPYDYEDYGKEILAYLDAAKAKAQEKFAKSSGGSSGDERNDKSGKTAIDFAPAITAAHHLEDAGAKMLQKQRKLPTDPTRINATLRHAERALLIPEGLPNRPWFHHAIYAPGQYTGYAAVVIPGVNEAIDRGDLQRTQQQIAALAVALNRCVQVLQQYH